MIEVNSTLISEIRILLVAEESEFNVERAIINELIVPNLKQYFLNEFNIDFNLIDVHYNGCCNNLPKINKPQFLLSEILKCQAISNGLSSLILIGGEYGKLNAPKSLSNQQFSHVLNFLQSKNDPSWIIFNNKYNKNSKLDQYMLDENISDDENFNVLDSIDRSLETGKELFSPDFVEQYFSSTLEKCIHHATTTLATTSSTYIIHRSINDTFPKPEQKSQNKILIREKINEKYENLIKLIRKKFIQDNFLSYSVSNTSLFAAENDLKTNKDKLQKIFEMCNFLTNKCRTLTKDLRISSTSDVYLQIFTEHLMKIIRDNSKARFMKNEFSKSISISEMSTHKFRRPNTNNADLIAVINQNREREMTIFNTYLTSSSAKTPGLIFGPIGSGKTTLLYELSEKISTSSNTHLIVRSCGKTVSSSSLQLLLASITQQINSFSKVGNVSQSLEYAVCVYEFWLSLNKFNSNKQIVILLDDVDKLFPSSHTDMVKWLPHTLPKNIKILLTSCSDSFYQGFKHHYDASNIVNIPMIDSRDAIKLMNTSVSLKREKQIPENILGQASFVLQENSTPLFLSLLMWTIDSVEEPDNLTSDIKSVFKVYLKKIETELIKYILSYLALSRFGLSLTELSDILSLDNRVLQLIDFDLITRVGFKFPDYIIEEIIDKCSNILEFIQINNRLLIRLKHNIYIMTIIEHYQLLQEDGKFYYQNMFDYWMSKFENGKLKSIIDKVSDNDEPTNESSHIYIKRNIMSQPYYTINGLRLITSNGRKLSELLYLLVTYDKSNELYKYVIFNFEFLFANLYNFGMNHLLSELYYCRQNNDVKSNFEVELLLIQLRLLPTEVLNDAQLLSPELTGRLSHFVGTNSLISQLHQHIDFVAPKINTIISAIPVYSTIDIDNLRVEIGLKCETVLSALSPDNRFIATFHLQKTSNEWILTIWDSRSATKSQIINLGLLQNSKFSSMFYMPQRDDLLLIKFEDLTNKGFLIINLDFSNIENIIKFHIKTHIKMEYISKSHLYLFINNDLQVFIVPSGQKDHNLSKLPWPTVLSPNDKYLIGPKPPTKRDISEKNVNFNLRVMNGGSGEILCQLILNCNTCYMLANVRNEIFFVSTKQFGIVYKYDIGQIAKKDVKKMKFTYQLQIMEQVTLNEEIKDLLTKHSPNIKVDKMQLSVDEKYLLTEYNLNDSIKLIGVWNLSNKSIVFCNQISFSAINGFSTDGQYFYSFDKNEPLEVLNLLNGVSYSIDMEESPNQVYMLKTGSFFMTFINSIKLASLKSLNKKNKISDKNIEFLPENFQTSLNKPKISPENVVLFSNNENTSQFLYYSLLSNSIFNLNVSHTNESLTEYAFDKFLSPDGEKLLLVFGFRLAQNVKEKSNQEIDSLLLKTNENGFIISSNNDYRKPEIPGENYFIDKNLVSKTNEKENSDAYTQKIVKIINLKTSQTIFQVSLTGEKILKLTDNILLTFKPDFASLTRNNDEAYDIVSIYHVIEGKFVSSLYIEHPVIDSILIPNDKEKLLVCCGKSGRIIKILGGEYYSNVLLEFDIQIILKYFDEFARSSLLTKLFVFKENSNSILTQYSWLEHNSNVMKSDKEVHYAKIDLNRKEIICQLSTAGRIVDVSSDGSMAIDSLLNVYELSKGSIIRKLQNSIGWHSEVSACDCISLFSNDASYIITLDPIRKIIWIILNNDQGLPIGKAILTSSFNTIRSEKPYEMYLGLDGKVIIVYNDQEFKLFIIKMNSKSTISEIPYKSNLDRIKKLL